MNKVTIYFSSKAEKDYNKLIKRDRLISNKFRQTIKLLQVDPFYSSLRTHKVVTSLYGKVYSSRITGNLRIIWDFRDNNTVILALTIGGHSGKNKAYK